MQSEAQDTIDGWPDAIAAPAGRAPQGQQADFGQRGDEEVPHLAAFAHAGSRQPLQARVRLSSSTPPTLVTTETRLHEGDVVYVESLGKRRAHRICAMRRGLRSRDPQDLRIAQLREIEDPQGLHADA